MALFEKNGYGQIEPNRLAAQRSGGILADVAVKPEVVVELGNRIENGIFLAWNPGAGLDGNLKKGQLELPTNESTYIGLVYTEVKLYDSKTSNKDFALFTEAPTIMQISQSPYYDKAEKPHVTVVPRLYKMNTGDVFTTNVLEATTAPQVGDVLNLNEKGVFDKAGKIDLIQAKITDITTLPDGQKAVKVVIIKAV